MNHLYKKLLLAFIAAILSFSLVGCSGGGVNGEGGGSYDSGAPLPNGNAFNLKGWSEIKAGHYSSAIASFNKVLADSPSPQEEADAHNGLGWAKARQNSLMAAGRDHFVRAKDLSYDAKVGMVGVYLNQASKEDMRQIVQILAMEIGKNNPHFNYSPNPILSITCADLHAVLAYAYAVLDETEAANEHIEYAKTLEPGYENKPVNEIIKMVTFVNR
ncbi:MAG: hypothetical protein GX221_10195 [Candidatus Riflebacteria bacterium]|nr:hypothetical protein [Candidatus Riflebacteria bacterium]